MVNGDEEEDDEQVWAVDHIVLQCTVHISNQSSSLSSLDEDE